STKKSTRTFQKQCFSRMSSRAWRHHVMTGACIGVLHCIRSKRFCFSKADTLPTEVFQHCLSRRNIFATTGRSYLWGGESWKTKSVATLKQITIDRKVGNLLQ